MTNSNTPKPVLATPKELSNSVMEIPGDLVAAEPVSSYGNQKWSEPFLKFLSVPTKEQRDKMRVPTYTIIA